MSHYYYQYNSTIELDFCPACEGCRVEHGELVAMQESLEFDRKQGDKLMKDKNYLTALLQIESQKTEFNAKNIIAEAEEIKKEIPFPFLAIFYAISNLISRDP